MPFEFLERTRRESRRCCLWAALALAACGAHERTPERENTDDAGSSAPSDAAMAPSEAAVVFADAAKDPAPVIASADAEADWRLRSGQDPSHPQPGVVWFHDFRSDAEVDAFRWTGGVGNDPRGNGNARSGNVRRITTDGVTGACLEILRLAGSDDPSHWWRPLSPIVGTGNGRGADDPGASGTIPAQPYAATQGGSQVQQYGRRGYYGHASYHAKDEFDGTEYYLQLRIKADPRRTEAGNIQGGKLMYQTITDYSLTNQEIVTYSGAFQPPGGAGKPNVFRMYGLGSFSPFEDGDSLRRPGIQVGSERADYANGVYCQMQEDGVAGGSLDPCWRWSGGWDTVMYHLVPGRDGIKESYIEVFAAHEGEHAYTKIWDQIFTNVYDAMLPHGYNAIILSAYQNGMRNSEFWHRYAQIIFSIEPIPCPQF